MQRFKIRPYTPEDTDHIVEFGRQFWNNELTFNAPHLRAYVVQIASVGIVMVAESEGKPIGCILAYQTDNHFTGGKIMYRSDIFVVPSARKNGVARLMMERLKEIGTELKFDEFSWEMERK